MVERRSSALNPCHPQVCQILGQAGPATRLVPASKLSSSTQCPMTDLFGRARHLSPISPWTRQQQERALPKSRGRASGVALPEQTRCDARQHRGGIPSEIGRRRHQALSADRSDRDSAAGLAYRRQSRQSDPRGRHALHRAPAQCRSGVEGHQHRIRRARSASPPKTTSTLVLED